MGHSIVTGFKSFQMKGSQFWHTNYFKVKHLNYIRYRNLNLPHLTKTQLPLIPLQGSFLGIQWLWRKAAHSISFRKVQ